MGILVGRLHTAGSILVSILSNKLVGVLHHATSLYQSWAGLGGEREREREREGSLTVGETGSTTRFFICRRAHDGWKKSEMQKNI